MKLTAMEYMIPFLEFLDDGVERENGYYCSPELKEEVIGFLDAVLEDDSIPPGIALDGEDTVLIDWSGGQEWNIYVSLSGPHYEDKGHVDGLSNYTYILTDGVRYPGNSQDSIYGMPSGELLEKIKDAVAEFTEYVNKVNPVWEDWFLGHWQKTMKTWTGLGKQYPTYLLDVMDPQWLDSFHGEGLVMDSSISRKRLVEATGIKSAISEGAL
jgi:hypothetical protein